MASLLLADEPVDKSAVPSLYLDQRSHESDSALRRTVGSVPGSRGQVGEGEGDQVELR